MQKKEIAWIVVLVVLAGVYVHFFTRWFERRQIEISASLRPSRRANAPVFPVYFTLNGAYRLTKLKVVPMDGDKVSTAALPVWDLVSDSNSAPVKIFRYGQNIGGMKPSLKDIRPNPLTPGVVYRLMLTAGNVSGYTDFKTKATTD